MATINQPGPAVSTGTLQTTSPVKSRLNPIFTGPNDLRAGWRLLIFLLLLCIPAAALVLVARSHAHPAPSQVTLTPFLLSTNDALLLLILAALTWVMSRIEHRRFAEYGLPVAQAFRKDFWIGTLVGFLTISSTLLLMFLFHAFRVTGFALHGMAVLSSLGGWGLAFAISGLFEEFAFRGYAQYTLASGIGFWPAALVLSSLFGLVHLLLDSNENVVGSASVVLFGLLLCFLLRTTGSLWCAVGFHAAYDWGQTCFYGVPDSGIVPYHNFMNSALTGPRWLTGGIIGPEGSIITPFVLLIAALLVSRYYRRHRSHVEKPNAI